MLLKNLYRAYKPVQVGVTDTGSSWDRGKLKNLETQTWRLSGIPNTLKAMNLKIHNLILIDFLKKMHDLMLSNAFIWAYFSYSGVSMFFWFLSAYQQPLSAWKEKSRPLSKQTMQVILKLIHVNSGYSYIAWLPAPEDAHIAFLCNLCLLMNLPLMNNPQIWLLLHLISSQ